MKNENEKKCIPRWRGMEMDIDVIIITNDIQINDRYNINIDKSWNKKIFFDY